MSNPDIIQLPPIDQVKVMRGAVPTVEEALANNLRNELLFVILSMTPSARSFPSLWENLVGTNLYPSVDVEALIECMRERLLLMEKFQRAHAQESAP